MNRIQLLPDHVANQIAAGEVVQRPVSVVKELVENAIDAGAKHIEVEYQTGGRSLIRITDDGLGMSRDDALLSLERHATSKIRNASDLAEILSFGFRGEALASIASVCRFTLTTRERETDSETATQIVVNGGKIAEVKEAGRPAGTTMEVRDLFFNVPARRKFLKSLETEKAHIQQYLTLVALAHPEIALTCIQDRRTTMKLASTGVVDDSSGRLPALMERWKGLPGSESKMVEVDFEDSLEIGLRSDSARKGQEHWFRLWGIVGAPGVSRSSRQDLHFFVNRRPVENKALTHALIEGYHSSLIKGRHPVGCLFLEIHPSEVDVNIHPAKREVKFHRERAIREKVSRAIQQALHGTVPRTPEQEVSSPQLSISVPMPRPVQHVVPDTIQSELPEPPARKLYQSPTGYSKSDTEPQPQVGGAIESETQQDSRESEHSINREVKAPGLNGMSFDVPLRYLGSVSKFYLAFESDRGLVLMDQRAASERVFYEQMLDQLEKAKAGSQKLLLPETVELSAKDTQFLKSHLTSLNKLGFDLSEFGNHTFLLNGVPDAFPLSRARQFVIELIDELKMACQTNHQRKLTDHAIAQSVSQKAVRFGSLVSGSGIERLVENLRRCKMPYTSPTGRPTMIEMNVRELDRKFGRTN